MSKEKKEEKSLSWLSLIITELNQIEKIAEPFQPIDYEKEKVIGELTEDELRLYTLGLATNKAAHDYIFELNFISDENQRVIIQKKIEELKVKAEILKNIFWVSVRDRLNIWGIGSIGIRDGRKIVLINDDDGPDPLNFFRMLFGD